LFTVTDQKKRKGRPPGPDRRAPRIIPTGKPRLMESSTARLDRADSDAWNAFLGTIERSAMARLDLLRNREDGDRLPCCWQRLTRCDGDCRCRGTGAVTVAFLRGHYTHLATEIALFVRPGPAQRRSS
jgi:hypothetical protein